MYGVLSPSSVELGLEYAHGKETREVRPFFLPTSSHLQWVLMWSARIASMLAGMGMSLVLSLALRILVLVVAK
jgi:hypothetical protein